MDGATQRPPDRLLHSFTRMSLTEEGDTSDALRLFVLQVHLSSFQR